MATQRNMCTRNSVQERLSLPVCTHQIWINYYHCSNIICKRSDTKQLGWNWTLSQTLSLYLIQLRQQFSEIFNQFRKPQCGYHMTQMEMSTVERSFFWLVFQIIWRKILVRKWAVKVNHFSKWFNRHPFRVSWKFNMQAQLSCLFQLPTQFHTINSIDK